ncbi:MAG TPA: M3 family metallopeptidase [Steroidobacteraceae bacterium]|nr:M3 family metallopeptidase [Steroidobacteraceae bacterium]
MHKISLIGTSLATLTLIGCTTMNPDAKPQPEAPAATADTNPLLAPWSGPYGGVPPWNEGTPERYRTALDAAIAMQAADYAAIEKNAVAATFNNTFIPMQDAGRTLSRVNAMFNVMTSNINTPEYQALNKEFAPKLAAARDEILFNEQLFARIQSVYAARESAGLTAEQKRLVERTYDLYKRSGAQLDADGKKQLSDINQRLASLFAEFSEKVLADENTWVVLETQADLAGLPDSVIASAAAAAEERGLKGKWVIVNTRSSVDPFLTFSQRRDLREKVWRNFVARGDNGDANDTNATIQQIVKLRAERARLLGYASHAHWRMADTMARDPAKAQALMLRVWPAAVARIHEEVADMQAIARQGGESLTIEPWDYHYYAEKVRKAHYDLDQAQIKPYFELNNMISAAFWSAEQLYGITFTEITGQVPVFHPDVRVWEVKDKASGAHVGLFYGDYFARAGKRSGAWATGYRSAERFEGPVTPLVSNNNNFVKGASGEPALISLDDATTLFHEFGHALHALLSEVNYPGLSVTPRDFVEYPSQVNEHWVLVRPVLDRFARHYKTGEPMPQALLDKIIASEKFNQGYAVGEYLSAAIVDMDLHMRADGEVDPDAFEREDLKRINMPHELVMRHRLPHFSHLFSSDAYSAGYYSYLWSEVMDADTWKAFEEAGDPFDQATAARLRRYILAPGNSTDRAEAFRQFRGRDPDVNAYLEERGFPVQGAVPEDSKSASGN